jgi:hypothetical protein
MNDSKAFYKKINKNCREFQPRTTLCRDNEGITVSGDELIMKRWTEHFNELLNYNVTGTSADISTVDNPLDVELEEPQATITEVELAIEKLKNNKAPGTDLIQAELIKHAGAEYIMHLHRFITRIWITETIPEEWNMSILCPNHKKGDITICSNYSGISLLNITYKILSNMLFTRLSPYVENVIGDYQSGFQQGRSTVDQIFTVQQILEKCTEFANYLEKLKVPD